MCAASLSRPVLRQQELAARAQRMRDAPSRSEALLWRAIRAGALGVEFRRQVVIGEHIVDFLAPGASLIVEVDDPYHDRTRQSDARRQRRLERAGYRVLRLEGELVIKQLPIALDRIREALAG